MKPSPSDEYEVIERAYQRLMWAGQKKFGMLLAEHNLTLPQFFVLTAIQRRGTGCPIGSLAKEMFQAYPTMTGIVDRLKSAGLVERSGDPQDRRKVVVSITKAGQQLLTRARLSRRAQMIRGFTRFTASDRREFLRLLTLYLETLEKENA